MQSIALIGFMGTGKSTVGKALAEALGYPLIDLDTEIVRTAGMAIDDIFARQGEAVFRQIEHQVLLKWAMTENIVLATGGGVIKQEENRAVLREHCYCIGLLARPEVIAQRVSQDSAVRPLLSDLAVGESLEQRINSLLEPRLPYYRQADLLIDTSNKKIEEIIAEICCQLSR